MIAAERLLDESLKYILMAVISCQALCMGWGEGCLVLGLGGLESVVNNDLIFNSRVRIVIKCKVKA
jgi:hypothetical protein